MYPRPVFDQSVRRHVGLVKLNDMMPFSTSVLFHLRGYVVLCFSEESIQCFIPVEGRVFLQEISEW